MIKMDDKTEPGNSNTNTNIVPATGVQEDNVFAKENESLKPIRFDDVLTDYIGQFGRYQIMNILLLAVPIMISATLSEYIFTAAAIPHRCRISECGEDSKSSLFEPEWILNAIPPAAGNTSFASCSRYESQGNGTLELCPANLFTNTTTSCNGEFVYARDNSVVSEFNLGCDEWLRALTGTLSSVGNLLALPITGYVSDRFGRRLALVINVFNWGLCGIIIAFSVNYPMYLAFHLLQATLGGAIYSTAYILATEFVGPRYRAKTGPTCGTIFAIGEIFLGAVAWLIQSWRYMLIALYIPCFFVVSYHWLLTESVRWQLTKQKFTEARASLEKVARINKTHISEKSMNALMTPPKLSTKSVSKMSLIQTIFQSRVLLRRVCTTPVWWITTVFVYYGLSINAIGLSDTMYLNFILTCAIEIPSYITAILIMDRVGRKPILFSGFICSAAANIAFIFIPQTLHSLRLVVYLLGKFGISLAMTSLYLYTTELYPTEYRHTLVSFSSMIGRFGAILAPLTPVLTEYWHGIPSAMFGGMAMISGLLVLTQPETLGTKLPDTFAEAEVIGLKDSIK